MGSVWCISSSFLKENSVKSKKNRYKEIFKGLLHGILFQQ
jgi:hypothetical protein